MKLVPFLSFLNQLKVYHWQTTSYAKHKALGNAYEALDELFDTFVETYYGKYGKLISATEYTITNNSLEEGSESDVEKEIGNRKRGLVSYLRNELLTEVDKDLLNIVDEIEGEINHLMYLLRLQ